MSDGLIPAPITDVPPSIPTSASPTIVSIKNFNTITASGIASNIAITFSAVVDLGPAGSILLVDGNGVAVISNISVSGATVTVATNLPYNTNFTVKITAGAVHDFIGDSYAGNSSYDFVTLAMPSNATIDGINLDNTAGSYSALSQSANSSWGISNNSWNAGLLTDWSQSVGATYLGNNTVAAKWTWDWGNHLTDGSNIQKAYPDIIATMPTPIGSITSIPIDWNVFLYHTASGASSGTGGGTLGFQCHISSMANPTSSNGGPSQADLWIYLDKWGGLTNWAGTENVTIGGHGYSFASYPSASGVSYYPFFSIDSQVGIGNLDLAQFLTYLEGRGLISASSYLDYVNFGTLITDGKGEVHLNSYSVNVNPTDATTTNIVMADRLAESSITTFAGNDTIFDKNGVSRTAIDGGAGLDTAVYSGARADYSLTKTSTGFNLGNSALGSDALRNIERLKFTDGGIALDVGATQPAGQTTLLLGAVLPGRLVFDATKQPLLGAAIDLFDQGYSLQTLSGAVMRLPIWDILTGKGTPTNTDIATYLLTNVNGVVPDGATLNTAVAAMDSETSFATQGNFLWHLAESSTNQTHVGLVGLAETGLAYGW